MNIKHEGKVSSRFDMAGHIYILLTLLFTVYGQLVLRWQKAQTRGMPEGGFEKLLFLLQPVLQPLNHIRLAFRFSRLARLDSSNGRFELNYAYPFRSLAFVTVMIFSVIFLNESLTLQNIIGTIMVVVASLLLRA